ncbi:hypothetical protein [Lentilactobacillus parafarraginis]|uniref:BppU N-terminal domain-containing protein n=2 Tax=Bacilli TaxID=91061 RepID=A0A0R1YTR3_9LACO|nr:hypothetical protein [Lentilactobacillus parafarraginis]KRM45237.1 hypothetical protein FD47_GL002133 [Lentilactobacillus parafarraginis DSM 18390 = JCM 14109]
MSKELAFTDDNDVVKYLDTTTAFNLALTADGVAFDLTNAKSILVKIANDDGYIMQQTIDLTTVTSPLGGTLSFPINQDIMNTLVPDDYDIEVWVTMNDGTQAIFPSDGTLGFSIEENLMSDTGEVIPVITLNDFKQQFDDLSSQMENAVHNVQKGDKGDKGDTGTGLEIKDKVSSVSNLPSTANEGDGYLVGEELYVWVNGAWKDCGPLQGPKGDQGIQGNTGTGVSSTTIQYQISNSATTAPTGTWSNNIVATTTTNPYLWMKATLNYTDDTTKDFYLVSQKGDKGDTGATGATGPIGPQGPVGAGLVVKGTVNDASQLPTTGNQEGYCYFVGTDLYVWDAGTWKNCGSVSPDLSKYVTVTDLNNGLSTKVTDNKDGTEQLNGVKVQPYNKLSDITNLRNIVLQTDNVLSYTAQGGVGETIQNFPLYSGFSSLPSGTQIYYSYDLVVKNADGGVHWLGWALNWNAFVNNQHITTDGIHHFQGTATIPDKDIVSGQKIHATIDGSHATYQLTNLMIVVGSVPVTHLPAPEDKVTDNKDGSIEVNGSSITPADDSKVVHSTDTSNWQKSKVTDDTGMPLLMLGDTDDLSAKISILPNGYFTIYCTAETLNNPSASPIRGIIHITASTRAGSGILFSEDKKAYIITLLETVTYTQIANDSKVAHLSGANNFDTVPTVNNNPLLLASSLPSDLARTGSDQEFTGKNTFDTAPIDKTTGHPYITKDSVPAVPDTLADTTKDANFTGKLQKSGIDVATTTDVNNTINTVVSPLNTNTNWTSLNVDSSQTENSDWEPSTTNLQYRIYNSTLYLTGQYIMLGNGGNSSHNSTTLFQLSSDITSKISFPSTNKFPIGILQALAQQASMFMISLTSDGKITCVTNPYDLNVTYGASMAGGFINAAIPLNL